MVVDASESFVWIAYSLVLAVVVGIGWPCYPDPEYVCREWIKELSAQGLRPVSGFGPRLRPRLNGAYEQCVSGMKGHRR